MLKQQARSVAASLYAADLASTLAALAAAYIVRSELLPRFFPERLTPLYPFTWYLVLVGPVVVIWTGLLFLAGAYRSRRTSGLKDEALLVGKIVLGGTVLLTILVYGLRLDFISRPFLPLFAVLNTLFLVVERLTIRIVARRVRARGYNYRTVVIIGDTPRARSMARLIHDHPWWGLKLLGLVRERPASSEAGTTAGGLPVLGSLEDFPTILTSLPVDEVILAVDRGDVDQLEDVFLMCEEMGVKTRLILDFFPHVFAKVELEEFDGTPLLTFSTTPAETGALLVKRAVDVGLALLLGIVCLPLAALLAVLIKLSSHGPVLFRQVRCGLSGRPFTFYKLRTMTEDA
ncbi:MAG: sugar transferase, partial [Thermoanaerobaculia bacterium]|nr:sugar transferase [Thermoanaerobaculia bacterium]